MPLEFLKSVVYRRYCEAAGLAYNQNMKRLALSVLAGFVFPFGVAMIAAMLSPYVKSGTFDLLAGYLVRWPLMILISSVFLWKEISQLFYMSLAATWCFLRFLLTVFSGPLQSARRENPYRHLSPLSLFNNENRFSPSTGDA